MQGRMKGSSIVSSESIPELESFDYGGRPIVFAALFGSYNYNLNTPDSDCDYKVFVMPTFDDLYRGRSMQNQWIGKDIDVMVYDIRRLPEFLWKSNPSFVELLFSRRLVAGPGSGGFVRDLLENRDRLASMNPGYLWNSLNGTHVSKMSNLVKGTSGTAELVDRFGYDTKQAMHALRILRLGIRYAESGFTDFGGSLWNEGSERDMLMGIRGGSMTLDGFRDAMGHHYDSFTGLKGAYLSRMPDEEAREWVENLVRGVVSEGLRMSMDVQSDT